MAEHPLSIFQKNDPKFFDHVLNTRSFALDEGALPRKVKLLIAMALDATEGAADGVKILADQAIKAGASKQEICEAIRVAQYICGVGSVYTAAEGLKDIL